MDFMEGLARSNHANSMLVAVIKYDHFLPLSHPFTAMGVAWLPLAELRSGLLGCLFAELFISSLDDWASTPLKLCMDTLRVILASFEALYGYPPCSQHVVRPKFPRSVALSSA